MTCRLLQRVHFARRANHADEGGREWNERTITVRTIRTIDRKHPNNAFCVTTPKTAVPAHISSKRVFHSVE
jgi:hypothetical protein